MRSVRLAALHATLIGVTAGLVCCVPPTAIPPPLPLGSAETDLGFSVAVGVARGDVWTKYRRPDDLGGTIDAQAWMLLGHEGSNCQAGAVVFGGTTQFPGWSNVVRCDMADSERWFVGPQVELGGFYGGLGLPVGFLARPNLFLYTNPTFRIVTGQPLLLPIGVAAKTKGDAWITAEAGFRGGPQNLGLQQLGYVDAPVAYLAVGATR